MYAKIYVTPTLAIVGSSNASSNGLAVEGAAARGWIEANIAGSSAGFVSNVLELFETIWDHPDTQPVRPIDIQCARERRERFPPAMFELPPRQSLFDAVRAHPEAFATVFVALYMQSLSKRGRQVLVEVKSGDIAPASGLDVTSLRNVWGYQIDEIPADAWLIDLSLRRPRAPISYGTARSTGIVVPVMGEEGPETGLRLAVKRSILIAGRTYVLSNSEKEMLVKAAGRIHKTAGEGLIPLVEALKVMDRRR
jgi:hypothetical protein